MTKLDTDVSIVPLKEVGNLDLIVYGAGNLAIASIGEKEGPYFLSLCNSELLKCMDRGEILLPFNDYVGSYGRNYAFRANSNLSVGRAVNVPLGSLVKDSEGTIMIAFTPNGLSKEPRFFDIHNGRNIHADSLSGVGYFTSWSIIIPRLATPPSEMTFEFRAK